MKGKIMKVDELGPCLGATKLGFEHRASECPSSCSGIFWADKNKYIKDRSYRRAAQSLKSLWVFPRESCLHLPVKESVSHKAESPDRGWDTPVLHQTPTTATPESHLDWPPAGNDDLINTSQTNKWLCAKWMNECTETQTDGWRSVIKWPDSRFIQPAHETTQNISRVRRHRSSWE